MTEVPKQKPGERSHEEVMDIARKSLRRRRKVKDDGVPALSEDALKQVKRNIESGGKTWEDVNQNPSEPE